MCSVGESAPRKATLQPSTSAISCTLADVVGGADMAPGDRVGAGVEVVRAQGGEVREEAVDLGLCGDDGRESLVVRHAGRARHRPVLPAGELPCDQHRSTTGAYQLDRPMILNINPTEAALLRYEVGGVWSTQLRNER